MNFCSEANTNQYTKYSEKDSSPYVHYESTFIIIIIVKNEER